MKINGKVIRLALTALGMLGVPITSWLSVKCHEKAKNAETKKEKALCYIPAIISGTATCACIGGSHHVGSKEIAALTATASFAVANRNKLEEKLAPLIQKEEALDIRKEVAKKPLSGQPIEFSGNGPLRFLECYSGRKFTSSLENVLSGEKRLNKEIREGAAVCMNDLYHYWNITQTEFGDQFGWIPSDDPNCYNYCDPVMFQHEMVEDDDGQPLCLIIIYDYPQENWMEII